MGVEGSENSEDEESYAIYSRGTHSMSRRGSLSSIRENDIYVGSTPEGSFESDDDEEESAQDMHGIIDTIKQDDRKRSSTSESTKKYSRRQQRQSITECEPTDLKKERTKSQNTGESTSGHLKSESKEKNYIRANERIRSNEDHNDTRRNEHGENQSKNPPQAKGTRNRSCERASEEKVKRHQRQRRASTSNLPRKNQQDSKIMSRKPSRRCSSSHLEENRGKKNSVRRFLDEEKETDVSTQSDGSDTRKQIRMNKKISDKKPRPAKIMMASRSKGDNSDERSADIKAKINERRKSCDVNKINIRRESEEQFVEERENTKDTDTRKSGIVGGNICIYVNADDDGSDPEADSSFHISSFPESEKKSLITLIRKDCESDIESDTSLQSKKVQLKNKKSNNSKKKRRQGKNGRKSICKPSDPDKEESICLQYGDDEAIKMETLKSKRKTFSRKKGKIEGFVGPCVWQYRLPLMCIWVCSILLFISLIYLLIYLKKQNLSFVESTSESSGKAGRQPVPQNFLGVEFVNSTFDSEPDENEKAVIRRKREHLNEDDT